MSTPHRHLPPLQVRERAACMCVHGESCSSFAPGHALHLIQARLVVGDAVGVGRRDRRVGGCRERRRRRCARSPTPSWSNCGAARARRTRSRPGAPGRAARPLRRARRRVAALQHPAGLTPARSRARWPSGHLHHAVLERHAGVHAGLAGLSAHLADLAMSACSMHSSMHIWHIAMHASSIDIMTAGVMPCIRSIVRIIVLHMSAQFMHAGAHVHHLSRAHRTRLLAGRAGVHTGLHERHVHGAHAGHRHHVLGHHVHHHRVHVTLLSLLLVGGVLPPDRNATPRRRPRHRVPRTLSRNSHARHTARSARRSLERMPTNTAPPRSLRRTIAAAAAALLLAAGGLLVASPASAHDELVSSDPAADAALEALPAQLTLTFSGELATDPGATELAGDGCRGHLARRRRPRRSRAPW